MLESVLKSVLAGLIKTTPSTLMVACPGNEQAYEVPPGYSVYLGSNSKPSFQLIDSLRRHDDTKGVRKIVFPEKPPFEMSLSPSNGKSAETFWKVHGYGRGHHLHLEHEGIASHLPSLLNEELEDACLGRGAHMLFAGGVHLATFFVLPEFRQRSFFHRVTSLPETITLDGTQIEKLRAAEELQVRASISLASQPGTAEEVIDYNCALMDLCRDSISGDDHFDELQNDGLIQFAIHPETGKFISFSERNRHGIYGFAQGLETYPKATWRSNEVTLSDGLDLSREVAATFPDLLHHFHRAD